MMDSRTKNLGEVEYDKQNCIQHEKIQSGRKIWNEGYLLLPLYKNRSITEKFAIKPLLKMMDSSIKNHGEVEYDKQNCLQLEKIHFGRKIWNEGYLLLPLYKNLSITKKFPIKTFLEMMDSSIKNHGEVEYDKQNYLQHEKIQSGRKIRSEGKEIIEYRPNEWPSSIITFSCTSLASRTYYNF